MLKRKRRAGGKCIILDDDPSVQGKRGKGGNPSAATATATSSRGPPVAPNSRAASGNVASTSSSSVRARFEKNLFSKKTLPVGGGASFSKGRAKPPQVANHARRLTQQAVAGRGRGGQAFDGRVGGRHYHHQQHQHHRGDKERSSRSSANAGSSNQAQSANLVLWKRLVLGGLLFNPGCQKISGKPKALPEEFATPDEYIESYQPLLLEEARAGLVSDWEENCENENRLYTATLTSVEDLSTNISHKDLHNANWNQQSPNMQNMPNRKPIVVSSQDASQPMAQEGKVDAGESSKSKLNNKNGSSSSSGNGRASLSPVSNHLKLLFNYGGTGMQKQQSNGRLSNLKDGDVLVFMDRPPNLKHGNATNWLTAERKKADASRSAPDASASSSSDIKQQIEKGTKRDQNQLGEVGGGGLKEQKVVKTNQMANQSALYLKHLQCFAGIVTGVNPPQVTIDVFPLCTVYPACGGECCEHVNLNSIKARMKVKHTWWFTKCGNLVTVNRQFKALNNFERFPLMHSILKPAGGIQQQQQGQEEAKVIELPPECSGQIYQRKVLGFFNTKQYEAVCTAATQAGNQNTLPGGTGKKASGSGFTLIHGPPGTGKTHTIWGILNLVHLVEMQRYYRAITDAVKSHLTSRGRGGYTVGMTKISRRDAEKLYNCLFNAELDGQNQVLQSVAPKPRILVCAPSNAAVDELCKRVVNMGFFGLDWGNYTPDVVRVSAGEATLSSITTRVSARDRAEEILRYSTQKWQTELHKTRQKLGQVNSKIKHKMIHIRQMNRCFQHGNTGSAEDQAQLMELEKNLGELLVTLNERDQCLKEEKRLVYRGSAERGSHWQVDRARKDLEDSFIEGAEIVFSTLSTSANKVFERLGLKFQFVLIDEAAQASEIETLQPLQYGARHCVLVGDPQQLPATVISTLAAECRYDRSLLERLSQAGVPAIHLCEQFRMQPGIRAFPSNYFYKGQLQDAEVIKERTRSKSATIYQKIQGGARNSPRALTEQDKSLLDEAYTLFHVRGKNMRSGQGSLANKKEVEVVLGLYDYLMNKILPLGKSSNEKSPQEPLNVGIITPYRYQREQIKDAFIKKYGGVGQDFRANNVRIDTIDSFQGKERDIVILSCVRSQSKDGRPPSASGGGKGDVLGFVSDVRRMNVAITRAKLLLWIVGDMDVLTMNEAWKALIENARERKRIRFDVETQLEKWSSSSSVPPNTALVSDPLQEDGKGEAKASGILVEEDEEEAEEGECFWENRKRKLDQRKNSL